jgi:hypothetical protein
VRKKIKKLREKKLIAENSSETKRREQLPPDTVEAASWQITKTEGGDQQEISSAKENESEKPARKHKPSSDKTEIQFKADEQSPMHIIIERAGKKFEMTIPGGPIYDLLVRFIGL